MNPYLPGFGETNNSLKCILHRVLPSGMLPKLCKICIPHLSVKLPLVVNLLAQHHGFQPCMTLNVMPRLEFKKNIACYHSVLLQESIPPIVMTLVLLLSLPSDN